MSGPFTQPSLWDDHAGPSRGPDTSHAAGAAPGKADLRVRVLRALVLHAPLTDEEVAAVLGEERRKDSVSKRRGELVEQGLAEPCRHPRTGDILKHRTERGSMAICWRATTEGVERAVDD